MLSLCDATIPSQPHTLQKVHALKSARRPLVTIGMPAYNEARFIRSTLESLLAQELTDFELLIFDNASTDETGDIIRQYASRDSRITYRRNPNNVGSGKNFCSLIKQAAGKYFLFASAHDGWDKRFLGESVAIMEADPDVVLCYSQSVRIDENGQTVGPMPLQKSTRGLDRRWRYHVALWRLHSCAIYGLHRTSALREVLPEKPILGIDDVVLAELSLMGDFACLPEPYFFFRTMKNAGDIRAYLARIAPHMANSLWAPPVLIWQYIKAQKAVIRRRAPSWRTSLWLKTEVTIRAFKLLFGLTACVIGSRFFPRSYATMMGIFIRPKAGSSPSAISTPPRNLRP